MTRSKGTISLDVLPDPVAGILRALVSGIQEVVGDNLVGVYLRGSLALGDFDPDTSDIDFLVATELPVSAELLAGLEDFHARIAKFPGPYARELEGAYMDREGLRSFQAGRSYPTLYRGEELRLAVHRMNWVLERWTVREHGIALTGPEPRTLIAPISKDQLRLAVSVRLRDWADWCKRVDDPAWRLPLNHIAYVVETMCRALYTQACGELCSKRRAVEWALGMLPVPWSSLAEQSRRWRTDNRTIPDNQIIDEARRFVLWAAAEAGAAEH